MPWFSDHAGSATLLVVTLVNSRCQTSISLLRRRDNRPWSWRVATGGLVPIALSVIASLPAAALAWHHRGEDRLHDACGDVSERDGVNRQRPRC